jgi:hypothetical protein
MLKNQEETVPSSASQDTTLPVYKKSSVLEKIGNFIKQHKAMIGGALILLTLAALIFAPYLIPALAPILVPILSTLGVAATIATVASFIGSLGVAAWITGYTACAIVGGALGVVAGKLINETGRLIGKGLEWVKNTLKLSGSSSPQAIEPSSSQPTAELLIAQVPPETTSSTIAIFYIIENMSLEFQIEVIGRISSMLSLKDLGLLVQTNRGVRTLFTRPQLLISRLLQHVAFGEQKQAEYILKCLNPTLKLGLLQGNVTDYSARTFTKISPFQYAAWALDRHMWTMIFKYLRHQNEKALAQLTELEDGKGKYGAHYDFTALIDVMDVYVKHCIKKHKGEYVWSEGQCVEHWNKVSTMQQSVPAHVVNEYCRGDRSFYAPQFNEKDLPRKLSVFDPLTQEHFPWYPINSNVDRGSACGGIYSGGLRRRLAYVGAMPDEGEFRGVLTAQVDLATIKALKKERTADFVKFKKWLQKEPGKWLQKEPGLHHTISEKIKSVFSFR